jgi:hypothetical protein
MTMNLSNKSNSLNGNIHVHKVIKASAAVTLLEGLAILFAGSAAVGRG